MLTQPITTYTHPIPRLGEEDDLSRPYVPNAHTKFTPRIANFKFPPKTKMPSNVKTYDGLGDPEDNLELFSGAAKVEQWSMPTRCHMFMQTLSGPARFWFNSLPSGGIDNFEDMSRSFLTNFMQQKRYTKDPVVLHNIKQRENEDLRSFMERYKLEGLKLNRNIPKTMEETMGKAEAFLREKKATQVQEGGRKLKNPT
ncbi:hypothetical protein L1987_02510 [Smallanthus sonchifolius]|uniref:Uncharacterized protein n=1 Tax=Smallanthus sonchifolius TaxID=185202 RepID=A0ACB9K852_9ASTR|nr:hypothetical protein L1987_02510 [Smallanthus sonchifolius]